MREALLYRYTPTVAVRKTLQKVGNSRGLILDRDLLDVLLPDGDLEQEVLVKVVGDSLVVRRVTSEPLPHEAVEAAVVSPPPVELRETEKRILHALLDGPASATEVADVLGNRSRPTVSVALNKFREAGWVQRSGREWSLTPVGRENLDAAPVRPATPAVERFLEALGEGPATITELAERLGVSRAAVSRVAKRALEDGLVTRSEGPVPAYRLTLPP